MPLIILVVALFFPRLAAVLLALFTTFFSGVSLLAVILGIIFVPMSLLWYAAVLNWFGGVWGPLEIIVLILTLFYDLGGGGYGWTHRHAHPEVHAEPEHH